MSTAGMVQEGQQQQSPRQQPVPAVPKRHVILVVDDETDVVRSVKDLLRLDYKVLGATSAAEGEAILKEHDVHVIMTDQRMPGITGVEFLRDVRGEHPDATRLLFTGYADIKAVIDAINQGNVYRYVTKPWDPDELQTVIREACERYDLIVERKRLLAELQKRNDELERAGKLKTAFIEVASHELRTPLAILMGLTGLASFEANDAAMRELVARMDEAGQRLSHLVDQLVKMLSVQRFDHLMEMADVDVAGLLTRAVADVRPFAELRKQTIATDLAPDLGAARLDADKIRDSLNHLLLNAIKFTPDGGRITVAAARGGAGGGIEVRVTDTGVGIDEQARARLFEPFFTGFNTANHSSGRFEFGKKGLGLGLSIVKGFVEMHGGAVAVESTPGKGTTVIVRLPRGGK